MISPLKDIVIATGLGLIGGTMWNQFKYSEFERVNAFYKYYDAQQAKKAASAHDEDDE